MYVMTDERLNNIDVKSLTYTELEYLRNCTKALRLLAMNKDGRFVSDLNLETFASSVTGIK